MIFIYIMMKTLNLINISLYTVLASSIDSKSNYNFILFLLLLQYPISQLKYIMHFMFNIKFHDVVVFREFCFWNCQLYFLGGLIFRVEFLFTHYNLQ